MGIVPVDEWNHLAGADNRDGLVARSEQPAPPGVIEGRRIHLLRPQDQDTYFLERTALDSRVLIIEGISGSGKDTFQMYLKKKLAGRDVYDYSEGEVLHSWKQLQIKGISKLRIKFMKCFVNYVKDIVSRNENAVFLLNRFHLSTYISTIIQQPKLEKEYNVIVNILRKLSVHVFILQLDENEIEERSSHPERAAAWETHQRQIVRKEGFRDTVGRHIWQQGLILATAERQQIPYSVIKLPSAPEIGSQWIRVSEPVSIVRHGVRMNAADAKISRRKRHPLSTLMKG
jgi:thymidylate kinase